jgi:restriction system protein
MLTTSIFSPDAHQYVKEISKKIVLIDGRELAEYMIDFGVGVETKRAYEVKELDPTYFDED